MLVISPLRKWIFPVVNHFLRTLKVHFLLNDVCEFNGGGTAIRVTRITEVEQVFFHLHQLEENKWLQIEGQCRLRLVQIMAQSASPCGEDQGHLLEDED